MRTACKVTGLVIFVAAVAVAGVIVLPTALPTLVDGMSQNPFAPVLVGASWLLATVSAIIGKRFVAAGHLGWVGTTTAHIGGTVTNRLVPGGVGAAGVFLAALRKGGASTTAAAAVVALWAVAGAIAHICGLLLGVAWLHGGAPMLALAGLLIGGLVLTGPRVARRASRVAHSLAAQYRRPAWLPPPRVRTGFGQTVRDRVRRASSAAGEVILAARARPVMALAALTAHVVAILFLSVGFATAVTSFGVPVSVTAGMASYAAGTALSATMPTPAGIGSAEATLVGALVVAGATVSEALPTVLLFRAVVLLAPVLVAALIAGTWLAMKRTRQRASAAPPPALLVPR